MTAAPLKILLVTPWVPWPPHDGGRIRTYETLRHLARTHRVTLAAPLSSPGEARNAHDLRRLCDDVVTAELPRGGWSLGCRLFAGALRRRALIESFHHSRPLARRIGDLTQRVPYDIIHLEMSFLAPYLGAVSPRGRAKTVVSMHNVESVRFESELRQGLPTARRLLLQCDRRLFSAWERKAVARFDGITVVSEVERRWAARHAPGSLVAVVPNGVDTEEFQPRRGPGPPGALVFTGNMSYPPNIDAAVWFCEAILPLMRRRYPEARFTIVGRAPDSRVSRLAARPGVQVTGEVADVRPYLAGASLVVVPLRGGGGTRLKILEAMAMGRPVLSTRQGAEGLEVTDGVNIALADDPEPFARAALALLASPAAAQQLGEAGRRLVVAKYDWPACLRALDGLYDRVLARGQERPARVPSTPAVMRVV